MDEAELEGLAEWAYRTARIPDDVPASGLELARRLLQSNNAVVRGIEGRAARLTSSSKGWDIRLSHGSTSSDVRWLVAHELAEWILARDAYCGSDCEKLADALAARLIAPRRAVHEALRWGIEVPELAEAFGTTQSCALLRQAEVSGAPTVLMTPTRIYVRGSEWGWPDETAVRQLTTEPRPGITRILISDARRRVGLVAG